MKRCIDTKFAGTHVLAIALTAIVLICAPPTVVAQSAVDPDGVFELSLAELLSMEVTSVSKRPQQLRDAAAAIHVITHDDIRRSGVRSIPEALRLAPGLQVARINANTWAVSARGFNSQWANKLLVLIDGRSVYVPSFSGVFWEQQDVVLADIERIEVIRGPGATVWGANAVNGVINIITRNALDTDSVLAGLRVGSSGRSQAQLRLGGYLGERVAARVYLKHQETDEFTNYFSLEGAGDEWDSTTAGFRIDGQTDAASEWKLQGDVHRATINLPYSQLPQLSPPYSASLTDRFDAGGWNVLGAWKRRWANGGSTSLQFYHDRVDREEVVLGQAFDTFDVEAKQEIPLGDRHRLHFGLGYRDIGENYTNSVNVSVTPAPHSNTVSSAFLQDEISLISERLSLTLGAKVERYEYTGTELQPSVRIRAHLNDRSTLWGAVSRAARTPSRIETHGRILVGVIPLAPPPVPPVELAIDGDPNMVAEHVTAWEIGYRGRPVDSLSIDIAAFLNDYTDVVATEVVATPLSLQLGNGLSARSHGVEAVFDWHISESWRVNASYGYLHTDAGKNSASVADTATALLENASPRHQFSIRSAKDFDNDWSVDVWAYWVSGLGNTTDTLPLSVDSQTSLNIRVARSITEDLRIALLGRNLIGPERAQFFADVYTPAKFGSAIYAEIVWGR